MFMKIALIGLFTAFAYYWQTKIKQGPIYKSTKSLKGKTVVITGGNAGIGKYTAIEIAKRDARLIIASRNIAKSEATKEEISKLTGNNDIKVMKVDLEDFDSVRSFAREIIATEEYVDFLVNNAGALYLNGLTNDGYGRIFTINHLGHFLLTNLLLDKMKMQSTERPVRIINVASEGYKFGKLDWENLHNEPDGFLQHFAADCNSKLAVVYSTQQLHKRLQSYHPNITVYSVHPGTIHTDLGSNIPAFYNPILYVWAALAAREPHYGAQTTMYTMLDEHVVHQSGKYFSDCQIEELFPHATDETVGNELWERSVKMVGLDKHQ